MHPDISSATQREIAALHRLTGSCRAVAEILDLPVAAVRAILARTDRAGSGLPQGIPTDLPRWHRTVTAVERGQSAPPSLFGVLAAADITIRARYLSEAEVTRIRELHDAGWTVTAICEEVGRTWHAVRRALSDRSDQGRPTAR
jgi:transposase